VRRSPKGYPSPLRIIGRSGMRSAGHFFDFGADTLGWSSPFFFLSLAPIRMRIRRDYTEKNPAVPRPLLTVCWRQLPYIPAARIAVILSADEQGWNAPTQVGSALCEAQWMRQGFVSWQQLSAGS
jgi:hypothetical protein